MNGRVKGTAVLDCVRILRKNRSKALEALPVELHDYLDRRILVGSWYPEAVYMACLRALVRVRKLTWEQLGAAGAQTDLSTVYAKLIRGRTLDVVLGQLDGLWRSYHDTGRETATLEDGRCRIEVTGYAVVDADYCKLVGAYNREIINMAGGRVWATRKLKCTAAGDATCVWEYDYSAVPAPSKAP